MSYNFCLFLPLVFVSFWPSSSFLCLVKVSCDRMTRSLVLDQTIFCTIRDMRTWLLLLFEKIWNLPIGMVIFFIFLVLYYDLRITLILVSWPSFSICCRECQCIWDVYLAVVQMQTWGWHCPCKKIDPEYWW